MSSYKSFDELNKPELPDKLEQWDAETYVKTAFEIANKLEKDLDTQLRKIFDTLRKKQFEFQSKKLNFSKNEIYILKPRLAYTVARKSELRPVYEYLDLLLDKVTSKQDFDKIVKFMESIIAYYKYKYSFRKYSPKHNKRR